MLLKQKMEQAIKSELKDKRATIASTALPIGLDWFESHYDPCVNHDINKQRLYEHLIANYPMPKSSVLTFMLIMVIKMVLWWLAERLMQEKT